MSVPRQQSYSPVSDDHTLDGLHDFNSIFTLPPREITQEIGQINDAVQTTLIATGD